MTAQKTRTLAEKMAEIALRYSLDIETCAEKINLTGVWNFKRVIVLIKVD